VFRMNLITKKTVFILAINLAVVFSMFTGIAGCGFEPDNCQSTNSITELLIPVLLVSPMLVIVFLPHKYRKTSATIRLVIGGVMRNLKLELHE